MWENMICWRSDMCLMMWGKENQLYVILKKRKKSKIKYYPVPGACIYMNGDEQTKTIPDYIIRFCTPIGS